MQDATKTTCKTIALRLVGLFVFVAGTFALVDYLANAYLAFIHHFKSVPAFIIGGLRFACRFGYPAAGAAVFFRKRWGAWLLLIVWLAQLVPGGLYAFWNQLPLDEAISSAAQFIVVMPIIFVCRSSLRGGEPALRLGGFFLAAFAIHALFFTFVPLDRTGMSLEDIDGLAVTPASDSALMQSFFENKIIHSDGGPCPPGESCGPLAPLEHSVPAQSPAPLP